MEWLDGILNANQIDEFGREGFRVMVREGRILNAEFRRRLRSDASYQACMGSIIDALSGGRKGRAAA